MVKYGIRVKETNEIYRSISACARSLGISRSGIDRCLFGNKNSHGGYTFEIIELTKEQDIMLFWRDRRNRQNRH